MSRTPLSPSITRVQSSLFNVEHSDLLNMLSIIYIATAHGLIHPQPQFVFIRSSCRNLIVTHPTPCSCRANISRLTLDLTLQQSTSTSLLCSTLNFNIEPRYLVECFLLAPLAYLLTSTSYVPCTPLVYILIWYPSTHFHSVFAHPPSPISVIPTQ